MKYLINSNIFLGKTGRYETGDVFDYDTFIADSVPFSAKDGSLHQKDNKKNKNNKKYKNDDKLVILPGFVDVHVHLREPGFSYKETIRSGSCACAHGGYTAVCTMPNLNPVPDTAEHLEEELKLIRDDSVISIYPYAAITKGEKGTELSDMEELADKVIAFSDDGKGIQNSDIMRIAMTKAKKLGCIISAHCEDDKLKGCGYIHDGVYALAHGHTGIPSASEWKQIERDLELVRETGCAYHICHVSAKESVELIRNAKKEGLDVTCETAPHYLLLDENDLEEDGRFKMNPPLRSPDDKNALIEGILDETIDMIATDHAPHSADEKNRGLKDSLMGISGIETAFPLLYTGFVRTGIFSLDRLMELIHYNPCRRFGIDTGKDFTVFDLNSSYIIDPGEFLSKGRSTPFAGHEVCGRCLLTVSRGHVAYTYNPV